MLLNVHSYYSLRYGTLSPEVLVKNMLHYGHSTAVLTDINNSSGSLDFIRHCRRHGLKGLVGMEFRQGNRLLYIGIAKNEEGFRELNELMTRSNREKIPLPEVPPALHHAYLVYPYGSRKTSQLQEYEYIGIRPSELSRIVLDPLANQDRYVILAPVSFEPDHYKLHRQLRAIDHNILISQLQPGQTANLDEVLLSRQKLTDCYRHFPRLISNTEQLLDNCSFDLDFGEVKNKKTFTGNLSEDIELLRRRTSEGFLHRYGKQHKEAWSRALSELDIIEEMGFCAYFLITDDICQYASSKGFYYVGRGSGANSLVAYCLGITDVCPLKLGLPFERFLNPERKIPPDFDIDFCWNERDKVYEYIFNRYPEGHVALMGAVSTFRSRSIVRELGKIYGLPKGEIDRLIRDPKNILNKNEVTDMILSVSNHKILEKDFPNQRTIHASGILISERPLTCYAALDYPPKGLPAIQFDMYTAEDINFEKFDILSQRGIGHIRDCRQLVKQNRGIEADTANPHRFFTDAGINRQLERADSIGCFYIESPAMRQLLVKLKCSDYLTLVAASSIIRPGVASSGMMRAYMERHNDPSKISYPHPVFEEHLKETYGVMVYQEDVMKIGHFYGGLNLAEADVLRRMMNGKYRDSEQMVVIRNKFFSKSKAAGHDEAITQEIWRQMESFAGFSFNKAHSASYAVESYQSLYLKTNYPLEFMVAVLNNYGGFYNRKVYVTEAKRVGGNICLPCINNSDYNTAIYDKDIYLGFDCLLNLDNGLAGLIPEERKRNGLYISLQNFISRTAARLEQVVILIRSGALRFTGTGKKELLWEAHLLLSKHDRKEQRSVLFECFDTKPALPPLETSLLEDMYDEIELIGFPVSASMFQLARSDFRGEAMVSELNLFEGKVIRIVGDWVCDKDTYARGGQRMQFGTFFDVHGRLFDTVHFPVSFQQYPLMGAGLYLIEGRVTADFNCYSIEVFRCAKMPLKPDPRSE